MQNPRVDLFTRVHKGLRALLSSLADDVTRARPGDPSLRARVDRAVGFLREHAMHEDNHIMPLVAACAPEVHRALSEDHAALEALHDRLVAGPTAGDLQRDVLALVEGHFNHMRREETQASAALWEAYSDAELGAASSAIQRAIPLPRMIEWIGLFLPAWTPDERAGWAAAVRAGAPPAVADALLAEAERILGPR
jgi:hypothetical protein